MKVLHVVGNEIEPSNGIGRLIPEMIRMHSLYSESIKPSLLIFNNSFDSQEIEVFNFCAIKELSVFLANFDLVVFHGIYYLKYYSLYKLLKKQNIKYLVKPHSSLMKAAQEKSKLKKMIANSLFYKKFIASAAGVIFTNEDEKKNSLLWNKIDYIEPNALDFDYKNPTEKAASQEAPIRFIYLSRIDFNHKGTDILLDALTLIKSRGLIKRIHLDMYGIGSEKEESIVKSCLAELNSPHITFKGGVFGEQKINAFKESDVFVLTSRYEGFPMAILEALYFGIACLVTPGANMSEILNKNDIGWLADSTPESIADYLIEVSGYTRADLANKSLNAHTYVVDQHSWKQVTKITEKLYSSVIEVK